MEKKNLRVLATDNNTVNASAYLTSDWPTWHAAAVGTIAAGSIGFFDEEGNANVGDVSNAAFTGLATSAKKVFVALKVGANDTRRSDLIDPKQVKSITYQAAVAGTPKQIKIDAVSNIDCETEYCIKIRYESPEIAKTYGYQDMIKTYSYVTRCCGTACGCPDGAVWDALYGLAEQVNNDQESGMNIATEKTINYMAVRNTTASIDTNDLDVDATFTQGSTTVTLASADTGYQGNAASLAVGDQMKVGATADLDISGVNVSTGAYDTFRVESVGTTSFVIDRPWPYATITHAGASNTGVAVIPKATVEAYADSTWLGVLVGTAVVESTATSKMYTSTYTTDFFVGLECNLDCNATVTTTTDVTQPEGYGADIQQLELWARSYESKHGVYGGSLITNQPTGGSATGTDYHAVVGTTYNQWIIEYYDAHTSAATAGAVASPKKLIIACSGSAQAAGGTADSIMDWWENFADLANVHLDYSTGV